MSNENIKIGKMTGSNLVTGEVVGDVNSKATVYEGERKQNLAEAAADIQKLLEQLSDTYNPPNTENNLAIANETIKEIENDPALKARVISALRSGGTEALKELIDHPAINIILASIEGWKSAE